MTMIMMSSLHVFVQQIDNKVFFYLSLVNKSCMLYEVDLPELMGLSTTHCYVEAGASEIQLGISQGSMGPKMRSRLYEEV